MGLSALATIGVPIVVKLVEVIFGRGKGKETKLPAAMEVVKALVAKLAAPGVGLPQDGELSQWIQAAVDALNKEGQLQGEKTVVDPKIYDAELFAIGKGNLEYGLALLTRAGATK